MKADPFHPAALDEPLLDCAGGGVGDGGIPRNASGGAAAPAGVDPAGAPAAPADSAAGPAASDESLMRDLLSGLSVFGPQLAQSAGLLSPHMSAPVPPAHCLHACLGGDPGQIRGRGCAFLRAAVDQPTGAGQPLGFQCDKGFSVVSQPTALRGQQAVLLTVAGRLPSRPGVPYAAGSAEERDARTGSVQAVGLEPAGGGAAGTTGRSPAARPAPPEQLLAHLDAAARALQRLTDLTEENTGFANEVLQTYEQLNLIFDLTQQIARVTDVNAIEQLLVQRVARLLSTDLITVIDASGALGFEVAAPGGGANGGRPASSTDTLRSALQTPRMGELLAAARKTRCVQVSAVGDVQVIVGPVVRLEEQIDLVVGARGPGRPSFQAGDMLLMDSVLAFGGQIISNSELHERLRRMSIEVTRALIAAIDKKDHYTSNHSERGGFLTRLTAQELGVPLEEQQYMEWAGLLHDVGKIGIPEEILCKPGKLTEAEFAIIREHPRMGYEILQPIRSFKHVLDGVLYHHEYPDGSGYPEGLKGEEIPLVARIIHVVDTFDALTSTRAYRKAFAVDRALEMIRAEMGRRIDGPVAEAFFRALDRFRREQPVQFAQLFPQREEQANEPV